MNRQVAGAVVREHPKAARAFSYDETGKNACREDRDGYTSTSFGGDGHAPAARAMQATFVVREILSAWALGFPLAVVYDLRDAGTDPANPEHNYGLIANDYTDKPASASLRTLSNIAQGRVFEGFLDLDPTSLHAMRLDGSKDVVVVLWSSAPQGRVPVTLVNAKGAISMLGASIDVSSGSIVVKNEDGPTYVTFDLQPRRPRHVEFR